MGDYRCPVHDTTQCSCKYSKDYFDGMLFFAEASKGYGDKRECLVFVDIHDTTMPMLIEHFHECIKHGYLNLQKSSTDRLCLTGKFRWYLRRFVRPVISRSP